MSWRTLLQSLSQLNANDAPSSAPGARSGRGEPAGRHPVFAVVKDFATTLAVLAGVAGGLGLLRSRIGQILGTPIDDRTYWGWWGRFSPS